VIPELGQFALILALGLALIQASVPILGAAREREDWMALARPVAVGQFVFVAAAFLILCHAFLNDDFTVLYVATNSNSALPNAYKIAAVWGAHEGSLLLWILILSVWTLAVSVGSRSLPEAFASRVLGGLGLVSVGMLLFTLLTSNPFERLFPAALDGNDLNPLLQDPALVMHPPILYMGYVGLAVPFAFAVAALLTGSLSSAWARWTRPWTVAAWMFLTVGIALGSWWAYYELGWGGWWFWDPVENASFMPWLAATALIHSLAVTERRGIFKSWTLLLAIFAFSLSLLGTFLVRSGILVSVHSFASDPARGLFILLFLSVITGGSLILYAVRARHLTVEGGFRLVSREAFLLMNNILLVVATAAVLFGTLYPLFLDALSMGKISVGPPYFNAVFLIPTLPLAALVGFGMHSTWQRTSGETLLRRLTVPAALAVGLGVTVPWLIFGTASALTTIGVIVGLCVETDAAARPGESREVAGYEFIFRDIRQVQGPNYEAVEGEFEVRRNGRLETILTSQKRIYRVQTSPMTESAIDAGWTRDLYLALGDDLGEGAWSLRVQYKPLVRFIWLGALIMALGGLIAITDPRYRTERARDRVALGATRPAATG
jgi:cytochrome c-type biogenesis protein CcmF